MKNLPARPRLVLLALIAAAFAIRVSNLALEGFWFDEADAIRLASYEPMEQIGLLTKAATNGPLYFLLLRVWILFAGHTEFASRYFSLLPGILIIPLLFVVARRLMSPRAGLIAAALGTFSSYLIFYSQETKMYSLFALLSLLCCYTILRAITLNSWREWIYFVAVTSIAFYSHVYGAFLVPSAIVLVVVAWRTFNLSVAKGVAAFAALTLPYLPLAVWQWEVITDQGYRIDAYYSNIDLSGIVSELFFKFTSRYSFLPDWLLVAVFGTVTLVGILPLLRRQSTSLDWLRTVILAAFIVVPIAISYVFVQRSGVFDDRYMILVLPVYFLALSFGLDRIARLSRTLSAIVILLFLVINAQPLIEKQLHGWATKEDWRGVVAYVEARSLPDDRFIFLAPGMNTGYAYYASQPFRTINLSVVPTRLSSDATFQEVRAKMDQSHRLWVILTHYSQADANSLLGALKDNMRVIDEHSFWGLAVYRFDDGPTTKSNESPPKTELSINFENKLRLVGMTAQRPLPEGDRLAIYSLYWEALTTPLPDYSVSLRLVDEDNIVWGKGDGVPGGISHSTKIWQPGQLFRDDHEIPITVGTPPGQYKLEVHVYERSTLRELSVLTRDGVPAGTKAPLSTVTLPVTTNGSKTANHSQATFRGELSLDQTRLEDTQIRPGEAFLLTTQWRTLSRIVDTPVATASLVDSRGAIAAQWPIPLAKPSYPLATWEVGHPVTGIHKLYLPATMADGRYTVRLSVQGSDGRQWPIGRWPYLGSSDQTQVGILDVHGREQVFEPPPMARQADLLFPKAGRLVGYELRVGENIIDSPSNRVVVPAGTKLEVRLLWRGVGTPEMELASFVHLLDSNGRLRAQHDGIPCEGGCPGRSWIDNEYLLDRHSVNLPPETKAGVYQLEIGLYNSLSGERLADSTGKKQETLELQIEVR